MLMMAGREMTRENITLRKPLATCHRNSHLSITWSGHLSLQLTPIYHQVRPPVTTTHTYLSPGLASCHHNSHLSIIWSGHLSLQLVRPAVTSTHTPIYHLVRPPVTTTCTHHLVRPPVTATHTYLSPGQATCHPNSHLLPGQATCHRNSHLLPGQATCHHNSHITWSGQLLQQLTHLSSGQVTCHCNLSGQQLTPIYHLVRPPVTTTHTYLS